MFCFCFIANEVNPGVQELSIHIHNKGYAHFQLPQSKRRRRSLLNALVRVLAFLIHIVNIQSVTPSSGGTAGGTHLTITGMSILTPRYPLCSFTLFEFYLATSLQRSILYWSIDVCILTFSVLLKILTIEIISNKIHESIVGILEIG